MAALLALETTAELCSVAIGNNEMVLEDTRLAKRLHNEIVLSMVDAVLSASPIEREEVACVAFSAGPGSFTGVRIAAGIAQGIALAWEIPVCPVQTSKAMALSSLEQDRRLTEFVTSRRSRHNIFASSIFATDASVRVCVGPASGRASVGPAVAHAVVSLAPP